MHDRKLHSLSSIVEQDQRNNILQFRSEGAFKISEHIRHSVLLGDRVYFLQRRIQP